MQGPFINSFRLSRTFEKYKTGPIFRFSPFAFKQKSRPGLFPSGLVSTYFAGAAVATGAGVTGAGTNGNTGFFGAGALGVVAVALPASPNVKLLAPRIAAA